MVLDWVGGILREMKFVNQRKAELEDWRQEKGTGVELFRTHDH